jgi:hypothetical protein
MVFEYWEPPLLGVSMTGSREKERALEWRRSEASDISPMPPEQESVGSDGIPLTPQIRRFSIAKNKRTLQENIRSYLDRCC